MKLVGWLLCFVVVWLLLSCVLYVRLTLRSSEVDGDRRVESLRVTGSGGGLTSTLRCTEGLLVGGASGRSCHGTNVCYAAEQQRWLFFSDEAGRLDDVAALGSYASSPHLSFVVVQRTGFPAGSRVSDGPTVLVWFNAKMWYHWLLDELLGLFWLLDAWQLLGRGDVRVVNAAATAQQWSELVPQYFTAGHAMTTLTESRCFTDVYFGPAQHHWGGPGRVQIGAGTLRRFARHFAVPPTAPQQPPSVLLANRRRDRLIVNADALLAGVQHELARRGLPHAAAVVYFEDHPHDQQLRLLAGAACLLAVHGSQLANMLWLPRAAAVVELFPYGFHRASYAELAALLGLRYASWTNDDPARATFNDAWLRDVPPQQRRRIVADPASALESWPANLYWINQDTVVDVAAVARLVANIVNQ